MSTYLADVVGLYQENPRASTPRSAKNDPVSDHSEDEDPAWFVPGVTGRNVVVRDSDNQIVAGFMQRHKITVARFYSWLDLVLDEGSHGSLFISMRSGSVYVPRGLEPPLDRSSQYALPVGDYILLNPDRSPCTVVLSSRKYSPRIRTQNATPNPESRDFTSRIIGRDMQCCLSGRPVPPRAESNGLFQAAHVYPTAWHECWLSRRYHDMASQDSLYGTMNSSSNGLTMSADLHLHFCYYNVTVDPKDNFLLIDFTQPGTLYRPMLNNLILDSYKGDISLLRLLLQEHYENTVLLHVRGHGVYGDSQWSKAQRMGMKGASGIKLDNPVFQSGIGKQFLETTLATRLYSRSEGLEPWPRSDDKGKYDSDFRLDTHTPSPFRSPGWTDEDTMALARLERNRAIGRRYASRPYQPVWE